MIFRIVAALMLAFPAAAQTPPRLSPLGPVQAPQPPAPAGLPAVQTPTPGGAAIQVQPLPSLTPPDPAFAPLGGTPPVGAPRVVVPPAAAPSAAAPPATPPASPSNPAAPASPPSAATTIPGDWQARGVADLVALDKVTARTTPLTGKLGETLRFGTLTITVRACAVRAPDQMADATVFLEITDRGGAAPIFRGWMFAAEPSLAVLEHPVYDVRLVGCRA